MSIFKKIVWLCLLFFVSEELPGQGPTLDSLKIALQQARTDSARTEIWLKMGHFFKGKTASDSAIHYYNMALVSSQKGGIKMQEAIANKGITEVYIYQRSLFDSSLVYAQKAFELFDEIQEPTLAAKCLIDMGNALTSLGQKTNASEVLLDAARLQESVGLDSLNDRVYINLSTILLQLGNNEQHEKYIRKAEAIAIRYGNTRNRAITSMALASISKKKEQYDSTQHYSMQALQLSRQLNNPVMMAYSFSHLADVESIKGNIAKAEQYYQQMLDITELSPLDRTRLTFFFGRFYTSHKKYGKAEPLLSDALEKAKELDARDLQMNILTELLPTFEQLNQYRSAYRAAIAYNDLAKEIQTTDMQAEVEELTLKYETERKEREINALRAENAEQQLSLIQTASKARQRYWWGISTTLFLLVLGAAFWIFSRNSIHRQKIAEREAALKEEKLRQLQQEQENLSLQAMLKGEKYERSRLARELHDGVGILLSSLKLGLDQVATSKDNENHLHKLVDKASSELRRIAQNMMPETLLKFGLVAAIEDLCDEISFNKDLQITFQHFGMNSPIFDNVAMQVYRILQELLNNVIKHAEATQVLVQFIQRNDRLFITIEDNGKGFVPSSDPGQGHGLRNIDSRVKFLNGNLSWDSTDKLGTSVSIDIPLIR